MIVYNYTCCSRLFMHVPNLSSGPVGLHVFGCESMQHRNCRINVLLAGHGSRK